ncbi:hypothetical protein [Pseudoalteromonas sp. Of7M-16]|uniref:hypothetical protein n=1 Tax=Pseudoalteromonas sp. Of7M-16 TaxID=2917756 RepID=UPI001EF56A76|nr:hypothetical protein [Pseudoalteromonas sp. Of7M-16]MCG7550953.1 hypothetical protein [Pseudoalteromonas sp. Of7M-16]
MALSASSLSGAIAGALSFDLGNEHCKSQEMIDAIAKGVVDTLQSSAKVAVNPHAGSKYKIEGVSEGALFSAITGNLSSFKLSGEHAKGADLPQAIAKAVAANISNAFIEVPTDTSGSFPVMSFSGLTANAKGALSSAGFKLDAPFSRINEMVEACCGAVEQAVSSDAEYIVNGVAGGNFIMI